MHPFVKILRISTHEGFTTAFRLFSCFHFVIPVFKVFYISPTTRMGCAEHLSWNLGVIQHLTEFGDLMMDCLCHYQDCFNRPIASAPKSWIDVIERVSHDSNKTLQ